MSAFALPSPTLSPNDSGSSYQLILEHILQYPGSYEIPLRTMYTLNCAPRAQAKPKHSPHASVSSTSSKESASTAWAESGASANNFTSALMNQISQLPAQPCSLPPTFIISFLRRCFHPNLPDVDFPQALAALDYLKDLETRRRKETRGAFERLGIEANTIGTDKDEVSARYPGVALWVKNTEVKERKVDSVYTQVYVSLRRWILINEMSLEPFNKHNCTAMLNTLYPPIVSTPPTSMLTNEVLQKQREGFFKYISAVERHGRKVLRTLMEQGTEEGEDNGWSAVVKSLDKYLVIAKNIIDDCTSINSASSIDATPKAEEEQERRGRKTDSGISFNTDQSSKRSSTGKSSTAASSVIIESRGRNPSPRRRTETMTSTTKSVKGLSTIEKITREFRRMRSRTRAIEADEMIRPYSPDIREEPSHAREKSTNRLKKMKSAGSLQDRPSSSRTGSTIPDFDADEMRRHRQVYEDTMQRSNASNHSHKRSA